MSALKKENAELQLQLQEARAAPPPALGTNGGERDLAELQNELRSARADLIHYTDEVRAAGRRLD